MVTVLQERLADEIIKNVKLKKPKNKGKLLVSVGYAESTATQNASAVLEQKGVQEALRQRGFNVESAKAVVDEIMNNERTAPATRLKATEQVFKVEGAYAPEKTINLNLNETISSEKLLEIANKLNELERNNGTIQEGA